MRKNEALVRFPWKRKTLMRRLSSSVPKTRPGVAEALERNGYNSAALNGDMNQALREQTLERLKDGRLDIP